MCCVVEILANPLILSSKHSAAVCLCAMAELALAEQPDMKVQFTELLFLEPWKVLSLIDGASY